MDLKYPVVLWAGLILLAAFLAWLHYTRRSLMAKYIGGRRAANTEFARNLPEYKRMELIYRICSAVMEAALIGAAVCALILCARPYRTENTSSGVKKRDIFLCLDVSYSIYELNYDIVDHLEAVVSGLKGDRFGICFFNTTSVLYVPMTDDYDFVIERLEDLKGYFQLQKDYMDNFAEYDYYYEIPEEKLDLFEQLIEEMDYFEAGTVINNSYRGSSLIGLGLSSALYNFPRLEEAERTRAIILVTDNWEQAKSRPAVELDEACDLCSSYDVRVYGVFPERDDLTGYDADYYSGLEQDMMKNVEKTGGAFYAASDTFPVSQIVQGIEAEEAKSIEEIVLTKQIDTPERYVILLAAFLALTFVMGVVLRK